MDLEVSADEGEHLTDDAVYLLLKRDAISLISQREALMLLADRNFEGILSSNSAELLYRGYIGLMYHIVDEYVQLTKDDNLRFELLSTASEELFYSIREYNPNSDVGTLGHFVNYKLRRILSLKIEDEYCQGVTDMPVSTYKLERVMKAESRLTTAGIVPLSKDIYNYLRAKYPRMILDVPEINALRTMRFAVKISDKYLWPVDLDYGLLAEEFRTAMCKYYEAGIVDDFISGNTTYEPSVLMRRKLAKARNFKPLKDYMGTADRYKW